MFSVRIVKKGQVYFDSRNTRRDINIDKGLSGLYIETIFVRGFLGNMMFVMMTHAPPYFWGHLELNMPNLMAIGTRFM